MASLLTFGLILASFPVLLPLALPLMTLALWVLVTLVVPAVVSIPRSFPDLAVWTLTPSLPKCLRDSDSSRIPRYNGAFIGDVQ